MRPSSWVVLLLAVVAILGGLNWYLDRPGPFQSFIKPIQFPQRPYLRKTSRSKPVSPGTNQPNGFGYLALSDTERAEQERKSSPAAAKKAQVVKHRPSEMTRNELAQLAEIVTHKIRPAADRWCAAYAGHTPFRPEEISLDTFKEWIFPGEPGEGCAFVINGTTVTFDLDGGNVVLDYIMAPPAVQLGQVPESTPPPRQGSVTLQEVLRLLKADTGRDFPPDQVLLIPTGLSSSMNGGLNVYAGKGVKGMYGAENAEYTLIFDPLGNLAYYLWNPPPRPSPHPPQ